MEMGLELLDRYTLPATMVDGKPVGGISALVYDRANDRLLALSDDHDSGTAPHFYTLTFTLENPDRPKDATVAEMNGTGNPVANNLVNNGAISTGNPIADNPITGNPIAGNPIAGNPGNNGAIATGNLIVDNPVTANPTAGNPVTGNPVTGNLVAGNPGNNGTIATGNPIASNPIASNPIAGNPIAGNPVADRLDQAKSNSIAIESITVESVTYLKDTNGQPLPPDALDPEGIALSPQNTLYISSEGINSKDIPPFLGEFDLATGQLIRSLPVPPSFIPAIDPDNRRQTQGIQPNQGLESLTLAPTGNVTAPGEPLRLFTLNESPLMQDLEPDSPGEGGRTRFLHYYLGQGSPLLVAEHLYPLESVSFALINGISEILALDNGGHFLTLERALTPLGLQVKLFEISLAGATDIANRPSLKGDINNLTPVRKRLLLNLNTLTLTGQDQPVRNWEGMTLGPRLPDGSRSLILVSDNNFQPKEPTEFLLFRLSLE